MEPLISISEQPEEGEATTSTPLAVCGITNVTAAALLDHSCISQQPLPSPEALRTDLLLLFRC